MLESYGSLICVQRQQRRELAALLVPGIEEATHGGPWTSLMEKLHGHVNRKRVTPKECTLMIRYCQEADSQAFPAFQPSPGVLLISRMDIGTLASDPLEYQVSDDRPDSFALYDFGETGRGRHGSCLQSP